MPEPGQAHGDAKGSQEAGRGVNRRRSQCHPRTTLPRWQPLIQQAHPSSKSHMTWAQAEHLLRDVSWRIAQTKGWTEDAASLQKAADVLTSWRVGGIPDPSEISPMSSGDRTHNDRCPGYRKDDLLATSQGASLV